MGPTTIFLIEFTLAEIFHCTRATLIASIPFDVTQVRSQMKFIGARKCTFRLRMSGEPSTRRPMQLFIIIVRHEYEMQKSDIFSPACSATHWIWMQKSWCDLSYHLTSSLIDAHFLAQEIKHNCRGNSDDCNWMSQIQVKWVSSLFSLRVWWVWSNRSTLYLSESYANIDPNEP